MKILNKTKKLLTNEEAALLIPEESDHSIKSKILSILPKASSNMDSTTLRNKLFEFGLYDFEVVNLINIRPKGLVHVQNIVEEMVERLNDTEMNNILEILK